MLTKLFCFFAGAVTTVALSFVIVKAVDKETAHESLDLFIK